jgi:hypothetical protein
MARTLNSTLTKVLILLIGVGLANRVKHEAQDFGRLPLVGRGHCFLD